VHYNAFTNDHLLSAGITFYNYVISLHYILIAKNMKSRTMTRNIIRL